MLLTASRKSLLLLIGLALPTLIGGGCPWFSGAQSESGDAKLVAFKSANEAVQYFRAQVRAEQQNQYRSGWFGLQAPTAAAEDDTAAGGTNSDDSNEYTTTNVQEAGVDEADLIKTDSTYFYIVKDQTLRIVRATPADQLAEVGRLNFDVYPSEMYLRGSKLILLAQHITQYGGGWGAPRQADRYLVSSELTVIEVDVSDPANPTESKRVELDGTLVDSRLTNDRLILVLTIAADVPEDENAVDDLELEEFLPQMRDAGGARAMIGWADCLHPENADGYGLAAVITLDADDIETIVEQVAAVAAASTIYASTEALYLANGDYTAWGDERETTEIHKFTFGGDGAARYSASGRVPGRLLNQFSLGEYGGYLRVASHVYESSGWGWLGGDVAVGVASSGGAGDGTTAQANRPSEYNAVYVLAEADGELSIVGQVEGIAPYETLHAARFLGDHGFLVTFHKIDPLFVIDLTDPTEPQVVGELEIPGFSDYLHPVDDTHLIGVGKYTSPTDEGFDWFGGVQISLFDVSDWANPTVVQQIELGSRGSYSEIDYTHKAFTYRPAAGVLAVPVHLRAAGDSPWEYGEAEFSGIVAFSVDRENGFTELGRIEAVGADQIGDPAWNPWWWSDVQHPWMRSVIIGDELYGVSPYGVVTAPLVDLETTQQIEFEE